MPGVLVVTTFLGGVVLLLSGSTPAEQPRFAWFQDMMPLPVLETSHLLGSLAGTSGGGSSSEQSSPFGGIDMETMMQMGQILSAASAKDPNRDLLLALRPLMKPDKQKKIDTAVKFLKLYAVYETLKEKGMLNKLGDIL